MRHITPLAILTTAFATNLSAQTVVMETTMGDIVVQLNPELAPISVENFLSYADSDAYDGTIFHRVVPTFVVQAGGFEPDMAKRPTKQPIENEWTNGLLNARGTIAMARLGGQPNSATNQFFFNLKDNANLDGPQRDGAAYAVFGEIVAGIDVIDQIAAVQTHTISPDGMIGSYQNVPVEPIIINDVRRASNAEIAEVQAADQARQAAAEQARIALLRENASAGIELLQTRFNADTTQGRFTDSGLFVLDVAQGEGPNPTDLEPLSMFFDIWTADGNVVNDSQRNVFGAPATISAAAPRMQGFTEAITTMNKGGERWVVIPPELGYGSAERPGIPPDSTLVMRLRLLDEQQLESVTQQVDERRNAFSANQVAQAINTADWLGLDIQGGETNQAGAYIKVLDPGDTSADPVDPTTPVALQYTMWTALGGEAYDSSAGVGFIEVPLDRIFPDAMAFDNMQPGEERLAVIPPYLAFGDRGDRVVPPHTAVIMQVKALSPEDADAVRDSFSETQFQDALAFLAENLSINVAEGSRSDDGIWSLTTAQGQGPSPDLVRDVVRVHYTGYLPDGTQFDSSRDAEGGGTPAEFRLTSLIQAWQTQIPQMQPGERRYIIVPYHLAYGERGSPPRIPPFSTLIFDIELLGILPTEQPDEQSE